MVGVYIALIIAILLIPASFVAGIILGRECVRLGLQYQIEAKNGQKPTKPPSKRAIKASEKAVEAQATQMSEWLYGKNGDGK